LLDNALDKEMPASELTLSADGRVAYYGYSGEVELKLRADGDYAHMRDWAAKLVGQMLRIAGIISVCEGRTSVDGDIIQRAAVLADWYAANAVALFSADSKQKPTS
jgi:hypothetical protein